MTVIRQPFLSDARRALSKNANMESPAEPHGAPADVAMAPSAFVEPPVCNACQTKEADLAEHQRQLEELKRQAGKMKEQARAEQENVRSAALEEGVREGREQATAALAAEREALAHVANALREEHARWSKGLEEEAAVVIFTTVTKIVGELLALDERRVQMVLARVLAQQGDTRPVVRVAPADFDAVKRGIEAHGETITVVADESILAGGCVIKTEMGELDARIDEQLAKFKRLLIAAIEENR